MIGREFHSLESLKMYKLRVILLETLWQRFVPKDMVFVVKMMMSSVISKLLLGILTDLECPLIHRYTSGVN